jgi:hypothetical protein
MHRKDMQSYRFALFLRLRDSLKLSAMGMTEQVTAG